MSSIPPGIHSPPWSSRSKLSQLLWTIQGMTTYSTSPAQASCLAAYLSFLSLPFSLSIWEFRKEILSLHSCNTLCFLGINQQSAMFFEWVSWRKGWGFYSVPLYAGLCLTQQVMWEVAEHLGRPLWAWYLTFVSRFPSPDTVAETSSGTL